VCGIQSPENDVSEVGWGLKAAHEFLTDQREAWLLRRAEEEGPIVAQQARVELFPDRIVTFQARSKIMIVVNFRPTKIACEPITFYCPYLS